MNKLLFLSWMCITLLVQNNYSATPTWRQRLAWLFSGYKQQPPKNFKEIKAKPIFKKSLLYKHAPILASSAPIRFSDFNASFKAMQPVKLSFAELEKIKDVIIIAAQLYKVRTHPEKNLYNKSYTKDRIKSFKNLLNKIINNPHFLIKEKHYKVVKRLIQHVNAAIQDKTQQEIDRRLLFAARRFLLNALKQN